MCVSYLLLYTNYLRYRYVTLSKVAVDKTIEGNYTRQTYFRPALRTLSPRASVEERVKGSCACGRREISVLCLFSSRVTCRTKRNPLRGLRKETSRSPAGISIYITLSLFFRVASLSPSPLVRSVSLSLFLSSPLPLAVASLILGPVSPAAYSRRRTTVKTHLLDQPASSLASYSILWPPTSKRRPGLSLLLIRVTLTLSVKLGSVHVIAVPFFPTTSMSPGQSLTFGASPALTIMRNAQLACFFDTGCRAKNVISCTPGLRLASRRVPQDGLDRTYRNQSRSVAG